MPRFMSESAKLHHKAYTRDWSKKRRLQRKAAGLCNSCGAASAEKSRCKTCCLRYQASNKNSNETYRRALKTAAFLAYGGYVCACCKVVKAPCFMQLDHIKGDGHKHLKPSGTRYKGHALYHWLKKNGYPTGFQVLCADCNFAKSSSEKCPHQLGAVSEPGEFVAGLISVF